MIFSCDAEVAVIMFIVIGICILALCILKSALAIGKNDEIEKIQQENKRIEMEQRIKQLEDVVNKHDQC